MKSVLLRAPVLTQSGYGVHARQIARWLLTKNVDVKFQALHWGMTPWILDKNMYSGLIGEIMSRTIDPKNKKFDVTFQLQLPNEWDPTLGDYNVGLTAGVETDKCNPEWSKHCLAMNKVVVPSKHAASSLGSINNVVVVPESFSDACLLDVDSSQSYNFDTKFNFLVFGQLTGDQNNDRKNIFNTLKWLFEEFKNEKDVGIVLKTNSCKNTLIDRNVTVNTLKQVVNTFRKNEFPKLHLVHGELHDDEIVLNLYKNKSIKALISATRGEGFGLPILEAAACGLPVIATGWSGHLDFLKKGKFIDLSYTLQNVPQSRIDGNIFVPGARWAEPSEVDFKKRVRKFYQSSTVPLEWAKDLAKKIHSEYSFDAISKHYNDLEVI